MFDSLVESGSHTDDLARKGSFFLGTAVIYAVVLLAAAVGSIVWYNDSIPDPSLELLTLVAPVPMQQQEEPKPADGAYVEHHELDGMGLVLALSRADAGTAGRPG